MKHTSLHASYREKEKRLILIQKHLWKMSCQLFFAQSVTLTLNAKRTKPKPLTYVKTISLLVSRLCFLPATKPLALRRLRFIIAFLTNHPKYQEDIQGQLDEIIGNQRPSLDDRPNLPFVQAAILEAPRVGNKLPLAIPRVTVTDATLCGHRVPKGTIVFANIEFVHLDPKCWKEPAVFNPCRHIGTDDKLITNRGNFYPFGAGRRVCAGEALVKVELFLFAPWLFPNFTFVPEEGRPPKVKAAIVQFPTSYTIRGIK